MDLLELRQDVKEIKADVAVIKESTVRNTVSLEHHIKRTDLAESRIAKVEWAFVAALGSVALALLTKLL